MLFGLAEIAYKFRRNANLRFGSAHVDLKLNKQKNPHSIQLSVNKLYIFFYCNVN